jgi:hypothetical protein
LFNCFIVLLFYYFINDSTDKTEGEASIAGIDEDEDLAGFRISVLKRRKPEFAQQLDDFSTFLMGKDVKVDELNVWDFKGVFSI